MYNKLYLQIYSVRNHMDTKENIQSTFKRLSDIGYSGFQTAGGYGAVTVEEYGKMAHDAGLEIIGTHYNFPTDVDNIDDYVAMHKALGTTNAGVGGMFTIKNRDDINRFIEQANRLAENLSKYGMKFTYHHHSHEFAKVGNDRIIDLLVNELDKKNISFVLDTYWLQNAGANVVGWIEMLAGRVDILHIKDRAIKFGTQEGFITEIGSGNIDFKSALKAAEETGVKHICVEQDTWPLGFDSIDCVKKSYDYFMENLSK